MIIILSVSIDSALNKERGKHEYHAILSKQVFCVLVSHLRLKAGNSSYSGFYHNIPKWLKWVIVLSCGQWLIYNKSIKQV